MKLEMFFSEHHFLGKSEMSFSFDWDLTCFNLYLKLRFPAIYSMQNCDHLRLSHSGYSGDVKMSKFQSCNFSRCNFERLIRTMPDILLYIVLY